jgi:hypothetical protein
LNGFAAARQASEFLHQQSADGVVFLIGKRGAEVFVEFRNGRQRAHREFARAFPPDGLVVLDIVFVIDFTDDLLDDIFDGHQTADTAVLIHHHGNVVVAQTKFFEEDVEAFALRNEDHRAHVLADLERFVTGGV